YDYPINVGKGAAVRLGLKFATGDIIIIQDAVLELNPQEYGTRLAPVLAGETDVVYGSRFLKPTHHIPFRTRAANWWLTWFTNLLFSGRLTDIATASKVFLRHTIAPIRLRCVGFDFEPELTAKLLRAGRRIVEVPISYAPRQFDQGKKIRWVDGVDALWVLLRCRLAPRG